MDSKDYRAYHSLPKHRRALGVHVLDIEYLSVLAGVVRVIVIQGLGEGKIVPCYVHQMSNVTNSIGQLL